MLRNIFLREIPKDIFKGGLTIVYIFCMVLRAIMKIIFGTCRDCLKGLFWALDVLSGLLQSLVGWGMKRFK